MIIYACAGFIISVLFFRLLHPVISGAVFEHDLLFFLPEVVRAMQGLPFIKLVSYWVTVRIDHAWVDFPMIKAYTFLALRLFGPIPKGYIFTSIAFHFANAGLIYWLCRQLRLTRRSGFLAGVLYLCLFAHFHAYMWPIAFQHLLVIFFVLLTFNFYLKTDALINSKTAGWRPVYAAAFLINTAASFCRFPVWIAPAMMLSHILMCTEDSRQKIRKYDIWLPVFVLYLAYPLWGGLSGADPKIYGPIYCLMPFRNREAMILKLIFEVPASIKFAVLFSAGLCFLFGFRAVLAAYHRYKLKRFLKAGLITAALAAAVILLATGGPKRLLIPYNLSAPFIGLLGSLIAPLQNAMAMDPVMTYYFIPLLINPFNILFSLAILFLFIKKSGLGYRKLLVFAVWYIFSLMLLYLWNPAASRYFIYVSPIFCVIFASAFDYAYGSLTRAIRLNEAGKTIILFVIACLVFCIPNLLAINLAVFRGRMANTFFVYDYARAADMVRYDLEAGGRVSLLKSRPLYINNIVPLALSGTPKYCTPKDTYNDNARWIFMKAFNDSSITVNFNTAPRKDEDGIVYTMAGDGYSIYNEEGHDIYRFSLIFEKALEQLRKGNYQDALVLLKEAASARPYLVNYTLPGLELEDIRWITGAGGMRGWLEDMRCFHSYVPAAERKKNAYIWGIINREAQEYVRCLFYISFLEYSGGRHKESEYWFSQIRFLEKGFDRLYALLSADPAVKADKNMLDFLNAQDKAALYVKPVNYYERYKFEKFIFRLMFKK